VEADSEMVESRPKGEYAQTHEVLAQNFASMQKRKVNAGIL
jgi:hypothetical protein